MLIQKLKEDRMIAMRKGETQKKDLLGCVIADSTKNNREPEDVVVLAIIKKFIDNANEVLKCAPNNINANREIEILNSYRPKQLIEKDIKTIAIKHIKECSVPIVNLVSVLQQFFKQNYAGMYDGKLVSSVAKELSNG